MAAAEMAFAGGLGARIELDVRSPQLTDANRCWRCDCSVNRTRGSCAKWRPNKRPSLKRTFAALPFAKIGEVTDDDRG